MSILLIVITSIPDIPLLPSIKLKYSIAYVKWLEMNSNVSKAYKPVCCPNLIKKKI